MTKHRKPPALPPLPGDEGPTPERLRKGDLERFRTDAGQQTLPDAQGRIGAPYRVVSLVESLARSRAISDAAEAAGLDFQHRWAIAGLERLRLCSLESFVDGNSGGDLPEHVVTARTIVIARLRQLPGQQTRMVAALAIGPGLALRPAAIACGMDYRLLAGKASVILELWAQRPANGGRAHGKRFLGRG